MPDEEKLDNAIALLACLVDKLGGEVVINAEDLAYLKTLTLRARRSGDKFLILYLDYDSHVCGEECKSQELPLDESELDR